MSGREKFSKILRLLHRSYSRPPRLRKTPPVDELVRTILSQNTNDTNSLAAFAVLKKHFRSWDGMLKTDTRRVAGLIKHAGLANIKARRIKEALTEIRRREGRLSLASLKKMDVAAALAYLTSLKGVGPKTAACVLLFSFRKPVMPVDTHIFRVTKRLGLLGRTASIEEAHTILTEALVLRRGLLRKPCSGSSHSRKSVDLIYDFHLGIIEHGRRTCKAQNPGCGFCVLFNMCRYKDKALYRARNAG